MPRKRRFFLPGVPVHVVQRGNNRQAVFFDDNDYRVYLDWLGQAASDHDCSIHAYVLMTNHIHLLMTPGEADAISAALQALGRRFVPYINHSYQRTGTLWEGRFKANAVQEESYCSPVTGISSSIRYVPRWSTSPKIIPGRATVPTRLESPIRYSLPMGFTWASAQTLPIARAPTVAFARPTWIPQCSATCAPVCRLERRSAMTGFVRKSNGYFASKWATALAAGQRNR